MPWALRTLLTISAVALPLALYIGLRTASSVGLLYPDSKRRARRIALLAFAWLSSLPAFLLILRLTGSPMVLLDLEGPRGMMDYLFLYPLWIAVVIVGELILPFILLDLGGLLIRAMPRRREQWRRYLAAGRIALAAAAILYVPIRAAVDTTAVQDEAVEVRVRDLPEELHGLRITLVGDIQVDRYTGQERIDRMHAIVRGREPELLLSAGDVVTGGTAYLAQAADALCGISGSVASIGVMGDHDQWSAPDAIRSMHGACGWTFLENEHRVVSWKGRRILVTGLTHIYARRLKEEELERILARAPAADIRVLLVHQPAEQIIHRAAAHGYTLVAAGHTHGGQIVLHPLGFPLTPSMRETRYYSGLYTVGSTAVVVTDGVGLTLAPIRYHARSEVTTIVLRPE